MLTDFSLTPAAKWKRPGFNSNKKVALVGWEFENETLSPFELPSFRGWKFHPEGSLRNHGFEYVLNPPMELEKSFAKIEHLFGRIRENMSKQSGNIQLTNSIRTSTHLHFNVNEYQLLDIFNFALAYWMLEPVLSPFAGENRLGNLFCLRLKDASHLKSLMLHNIRSKQGYNGSLFGENYRYSSVNFNSIQKFGSLEFRLLRGTEDTRVIETWGRAIEAIRQWALKYETPLQMKKAFLNDYEAKYFAEAVLGDQFFSIASALPKGFSVEKEVRAGFMDVLPIMNAHDTFDFREDIKALQEKAKADYEKKKVAFDLRRDAWVAAYRRDHPEENFTLQQLEAYYGSAQERPPRPPEEQQIPSEIPDDIVVELPRTGAESSLQATARLLSGSLLRSSPRSTWNTVVLQPRASGYVVPNYGGWEDDEAYDIQSFSRWSQGAAIDFTLVVDE